MPLACFLSLGVSLELEDKKKPKRNLSCWGADSEAFKAQMPLSFLDGF